jgi:hypothetical protein
MSAIVKHILLIGTGLLCSYLLCVVSCRKDEDNEPAPEPSLSLTAPNGNEVWFVGDADTIRWNSVGLNENVRIELNRNFPSGTWESISGSAANNGSYGWLVTDTVTTVARVRIRGVANSNKSDISDLNFSIGKRGIVLTAPNGGETLFIGDADSVRWTTTSPPQDSIKIELNRGYPIGGWETITAKFVNSGSFPWLISGTAGTNARMRIRSFEHPAVGDSSNANFSLAVRSIIVNRPAGGELFAISATDTIKWTSNLLEPLKIELNRSYPSDAWEIIYPSAGNTGRLAWTVVGPVTIAARVRITGVLHTSVGDTSNTDFTIATPELALLAPNGGESLTIGYNDSIRWTSSNLPGNVKIEYTTAYPSGAWQVIAFAPNTGVYVWTVTEPSTSTARVRVSSVFLPLLSDESDSSFTISGRAIWTVMAYCDGNNTLDGSGGFSSSVIRNVQDMELVGNQDVVHIIAMVTSMRTGGVAKYYHVEYRPAELPDSISSPMLLNRGLKDMSDPTTLREFINYCTANYPAQHYILVLDDHGAGWPGSCLDEVNGGGGFLTMPELKEAISQSDISHVDIVVFHASSMAMAEVAYELRNVADYMVAGQFVMPMTNLLAADLWLDWLRSNPGMSSANVAQKIAENVIVRAQAHQKTIQFAVIALEQMPSLASEVGSLGNILIANAAPHWNEVLDAWDQVHASFDAPAFVDLREFAVRILQETNLGQNNLIQNAANNVIALMSSAVPFTSVYFQPPDQPVARGGLSIHLPVQYGEFDSSNYAALEFQQTNWINFLSAFLQNAGGQEPTGRCCYNNNTQCVVSTQSECAQLQGIWTQGLNCTAPCQQPDCADSCHQAQTIQIGQNVEECQFTDQHRLHWFRITLNPGTYRFHLSNFPQGADYDLYTFGQCSDYPSSPTLCSGNNAGPEDFQCVISSTVQIQVLASAFQGPYGNYSLLISQLSEPAADAPVIDIGKP